MNNQFILGVLASGRGSDLQSIIDAIDNGQLKTKIGVVLTDKPEAMALERARKAGIPAVCVDRKQNSSKEEFEQELIAQLKKYNVNLVILAGFMRILSPCFVNAFKNSILNIHPSLLPSFTGAHAHRDVLAYGVKVSGCTVHFVDEGMDSGPIIMQKAVPVLDDDTEDTLAARVLEQEHIVYPKVIELFISGKIHVDGRHVTIDE